MGEFSFPNVETMEQLQAMIKESALKTLLKSELYAIVTDLSEVRDPSDGIYRMCVLCGANTGDLTDVRSHKRNCSWARAKRYVERDQVASRRQKT